MKTLSIYTENKFNILFEKYNGFFAFSQSQIDEAKKQNIKYVYRGGGLYHEAGKEEEFDTDYKLVVKEAIEQDLKENGKRYIIERELKNYECYYVNNIKDAVEVLKEYNITYSEVLNVFEETKEYY